MGAESALQGGSERHLVFLETDEVHTARLLLAVEVQQLLVRIANVSLLLVDQVGETLEHQLYFEPILLLSS